MSERYKPKQLLRARGSGPAKLQVSHTVSATERLRQRCSNLEGSGKLVVRCRLHGVHWLDCTLCSRPK